LEFFIQSNMGKNPLLRIDCLTPYKGSEQDIIKDVCCFLSNICSDIDVNYNVTQNVSTEEKDGYSFVNFLVIQLNIKAK